MNRASTSPRIVFPISSLIQYQYEAGCLLSGKHGDILYRDDSSAQKGRTVMCVHGIGTSRIVALHLCNGRLNEGSGCWGLE